ncbi:alpha/beta-hydrolase [Aspergillus indologenus CBS 114.80]|uniref:Alpha/beta-hydrolase n=1 Tax=Aspergillus indologenus CBS 114.80 TaxID=1450541 RepID=A0A2V5HTI9_9EURO|nr:alpha/beta-hydrolase [Aspergillus indologenus CBS 114.80]
MATNSVSRLLTHPNGQTTHVIIDDYTDPWGEPETIMLQGGFGRHGRLWYHWVPALARRYRVVRRDPRGHGGSSAPAPNAHAHAPAYRYDLATMLAELVDTLDQLGLPRVHFVGESTSGMLAAALAATAPGRLRSVVLRATPTHLPPAALELFAFGHADWPTACRTLGARGWAEQLARRPGTAGGAPGDDPRARRWWLDQWGRSSGEALACYASFLATLDIRPLLGQIPVPVLVLAPARSAAVGLDAQRAMAARIPGATLAVIDGPGHEIYWDAAAECLAALGHFLDRLGEEEEEEEEEEEGKEQE